jgi:hypothetical protein
MSRVVAVVVLVTSLSGCWLQPGVDAGQTNWNATETILTSANVGDVVQQWSYVPPAGFHSLGVSVNGRIALVTRQQTRITDPSKPSLVTSIDAATGQPVWTTELPWLFGNNTGSPVYLDGQLVVPRLGGINTDGRIDRLDAATGALTDDTFTPGVQRLTVADGQLAQRRTTDEGDNSTQHIEWRYHAALTYYRVGGAPEPGPYAFVGDRLMWSMSTVAYGYGPTCSADPCPPTWTTDLGGLRITGVAAAGDDQVVYTDYGPTLSVLDAATGTIRWQAHLPGPSDPVVADGMIFVTAASSLYAFPAQGCGVALCDPVWSGTLPAGDRRMVAAGDVLYVLHPSSTNGITAFPVHGCGAPSCPALATIGAGFDVRDLIVDAGHIIALTGDDHVVAFGLPPGPNRPR